MKKQSEQFPAGRLLTQRVLGYVKTWESRCYSEGIPEEVPLPLSRSGRAPSYKAIAMCILNNDISLRGLGMVAPDCDAYKAIKSMEDG